MKKYIIALIILASAYFVSFTQNDQPADYIMISKAMGKLVVGGIGIGSDEVESVRTFDGKKAKSLMQAVEIYEQQGYEVVTIYGNDSGHFAVMRK